MDAVSTGAAGIQLISATRDVYRRISNACKAPEHLGRITRDTRNRIAMVEQLVAQAAAGQTLCREAGPALDDLQEVFRLTNYPNASSLNDTHSTGASKMLWKQRLQVSLQYFFKQGRVSRAQEAINSRVPWLLLDTIVNIGTHPLPATSDLAIGSSTTVNIPVKSKCEISFSSTICSSIYTSRNVELDMLTNIIALCKGQPRAALVGLPGIGKTRLALEYARLVHQRSPATRVYLVYATSEDQLFSNLVEIDLIKGKAAPVAEHHPVGTDCPKSSANDITNIIIVDEYNHRNALFGPKRLVDWLPEDKSCVILFLSWDSSLIVNVVEKDCILRLRGINPQDYANAFHDDGSQLPADTIQKLYSTIGSSPLSLQLALIYMRDNDIGVNEYLNLFIQVAERANLFQHKVFDPLSGQSKSILDSVLRISHTVEECCSLAFKLLKIACYTMNLDIPHHMLRLWCSDSCETDLQNGIGYLKRLSIFSYNESTKTYSVDQMIASVLQCHLYLTNELESAMLLASEAILDCIPNKYVAINNREYDSSCLEHGKAILYLYEQQRHMKLNRSSATMASTVVQALQDLGYHEQAQDLARVVVILAKTSFGDEDEQSLTARSNLAKSLDYAGKFSEAEEETRMVLHQRRLLLGSTNPATLTSMKNLALAIEHQGRHEEAEALYRELIDLQVQTEAPHSKAMLATQQNLAVSLQTQGKLEEAEHLFRQVLDGRKQHGEGTLAVYLSMSNVGCSQWGQNRVDEAWNTHNDVFSRCEKDLGRDHPQTIRSMTWIALILQSMGDKYLGAAELYWTEALGLYRARLGRQHPDTLRTQRGLVTILHKRGLQGRALRLCQELYELTRKHREFGPRHPDFLAIKKHQKQLMEEIAEAKRDEVGSWPSESSCVYLNS